MLTSTSMCTRLLLPKETCRACQKRPAELGYRAEFGPSEAHCKCPQQMDKVLAIYDNVFAPSHLSSTTTNGCAADPTLYIETPRDALALQVSFGKRTQNSPGCQTINKIFFPHLPLFVTKVHTKPKNGLKQSRPLLMVPTEYGVATVGRIDKITGIFCRTLSLG